MAKKRQYYVVKTRGKRMPWGRQKETIHCARQKSGKKLEAPKFVPGIRAAS